MENQHGIFIDEVIILVNLDLANSPIFLQMEKKDCCGCEVCMAVCPTKCITMKEDSEGFLFPYMDETKCISCGKCTKCCPVLQVKENVLIKDTYAGYSASSEIVEKSASGGAFSVIVNSFLNTFKTDAFVAGVVWDDDFKGCHHVVTNNIAKIENMKSSKYVQSKKGNVYSQIEELLKKNKKVLFSGTPCEVAGLKQMIGKEYENLITIDIVCQGPSSPKAMESFVDIIERKYRSKINKMNMRFVQREPWIPQWLKIDFKNNKTFLKLFYETEIGRAVHIMQRWSCYSCHFCGNNHASDITIGDYHGADINEDYYNPRGTSIVIINTIKGKKIFNNITEKESKWFHVDYNMVVKSNPRILRSWEPHKMRKEFGKKLGNNDLHDAAKISWSFRQKLRMKVPYDFRIILRELRQRNK